MLRALRIRALLWPVLGALWLHLLSSACSGQLTSTLTVPIPTQFVGVTVDSAGAIYICANIQSAPGYVYKLSPSGALLATFIIPGACQGIALGSSGLIYAMDAVNATVVVLQPNGTLSATLTAVPAFGGAWGVVVSPAGDVYVADGNNRRVWASLANGSVVSYKATSDGLGLNDPHNLVLDPTGYSLWVSEWNEYRVTQLRLSDGVVLKRLTAPLGVDPRGVALDSLSNLYVADQYSFIIHVFLPNGSWSHSLTYPSMVPIDLFMDGSDNLYVCDTLSLNRIVIFHNVTAGLPRPPSLSSSSTAASPTLWSSSSSPSSTAAAAASSSPASSSSASLRGSSSSPAAPSPSPSSSPLFSSAPSAAPLSSPSSTASSASSSGDTSQPQLQSSISVPASSQSAVATTSSSPATSAIAAVTGFSSSSSSPSASSATATSVGVPSATTAQSSSAGSKSSTPFQVTSSSLSPSPLPAPVAPSTASSTPVGAIVGGVVGGAVGLLLCCGLVIALVYSRRGTKQGREAHSPRVETKVFKGEPPSIPLTASSSGGSGQPLYQYPTASFATALYSTDTGSSGGGGLRSGLPGATRDFTDGDGDFRVTHVYGSQSLDDRSNLGPHAFATVSTEDGRTVESAVAPAPVSPVGTNVVFVYT